MDNLTSLEALSVWHRAYVWDREADATAVRGRNGEMVFVDHEAAANLIDDVVSYIRRCASNCPEANELLRRTEPR